MPRYLRNAPPSVALALTFLLSGCPGNTPAPAALAKLCPTATTGKVSGSVGLFPISGTSVTVTEPAPGTINWQPSGSGTAIDGTTESGAVTAGTPFTLTGAASGGRTITVTGILSANCRGGGTWTFSGTPGGSGSWSVP
ncbi:MAG: hypothetical protein NVSMB64_27620 [Candidatus Velthaea sp.]